MGWGLVATHTFKSINVFYTLDLAFFPRPPGMRGRLQPVLVLVDILSQFIFLRKVKSAKGVAIAETLERLFTETGRVPQRLITDQVSIIHIFRSPT